MSSQVPLGKSHSTIADHRHGSFVLAMADIVHEMTPHTSMDLI